MNDQNSNVFRQKLRQSLTEALLTHIEQGIDDEIPPDFPTNSRKAILEEVLANSAVVLDALEISQLQNSELCLERHIEGVLAYTTFLVHQYDAQRSRS